MIGIRCLPTKRTLGKSETNVSHPSSSQIFKLLDQQVRKFLIWKAMKMLMRESPELHNLIDFPWRYTFNSFQRLRIRGYRLLFHFVIL